MNLEAILTLVGFVVAALLAGGGITYGVLTRDKCALPGITTFDSERIPIMLIPDHALSSGMKDALQKAIDFWNRAVGAYTVIRVGEPPHYGGPPVFTDLGELVDGGSLVPVMPYTGSENRRRRKAFAYAELRLNKNKDGIRLAAIYIDLEKISWLDSQDQLVRALAHEMGHVLGLAHDGVLDSVMYRKALSSQAYVTDRDAAFLKGAYGLNVVALDEART